MNIAVKDLKLGDTFEFDFTLKYNIKINKDKGFKPLLEFKGINFEGLWNVIKIGPSYKHCKQNKTKLIIYTSKRFGLQEVFAISRNKNVFQNAGLITLVLDRNIQNPIMTDSDKLHEYLGYTSYLKDVIFNKNRADKMSLDEFIILCNDLIKATKKMKKDINQNYPYVDFSKNYMQI